MEKMRRNKIILIVALMLVIAGTSLGFAAFSTVLNISSTASVTPNSSSFAVKFSTSPNSLVVQPVVPSSISSGMTATDGIIQNGPSPTLTNLSANFTSPGQYVEYTLFVRNEGEFDAYLNSVNFLGDKECIAAIGTTDSLVQDACNSIDVTAGFQGQMFSETTQFSGIALEPGEFSEMVVKLEYDVSGASADGEFSITFPDIAILFSTVDDEATVKNTPCKYTSDSDGNEMVKCGKEMFYVVQKTSESVSMLTQYNLTLDTNNPEQDPGDIDFMSINSISFAASVYWNGGGYSQDGNPDYAYVYDSSANAYPYVEAYKYKLVGMGVNVNQAKLISFEQLSYLGCTEEDCSAAPDWLGGSTYWLGFVDSNSAPVYIQTNKHMSFMTGLDGCNGYCGGYVPGVRPVIEIPASDVR